MEVWMKQWNVTVILQKKKKERYIVTRNKFSFRIRNEYITIHPLFSLRQNYTDIYNFTENWINLRRDRQ